jgi:hypothetical protein
MDLKKPLIDVVKQTVQVKINLVGLADGLVDEVLEPALKEVVADTTNTFDDMAMAMIYPTLELKLKELYAAKLAEVQKQLDEALAKVLG